MTLMAASKDHEVWLQNNKSRDTEMHANLCSITTHTKKEKQQVNNNKFKFSFHFYHFYKLNISWKFWL